MATKRLLVSIITIAISLSALLALPAAAEAQRRGMGRGPGRPGGRIVMVGGGIRQPGIFLGQRGPWGPYGPVGGYGPYGPWGGPYGGYYGGQFYGASVRIEVEPENAEVYVDGWNAGIVDKFDSWYQSLNVSPGEHEITLYLEGYRTQSHKLYLSPGTTQHIKGTMEKLSAGESSGPRPQPAPARDPGTVGAGAPRTGQATVEAPAPPQPARFGTLSLRVQPADAQILVDNQPWTNAAGDLRLSIKLSAGRHHIEVKKDGFEPYVEDILIRPEATMTLNVGLTKKGW